MAAQTNIAEPTVVNRINVDELFALIDPLSQDTNARSAGSAVATGRFERLAGDLAHSFNVQAGWRHLPVPEEGIVLEREHCLVVRISAPADELTLNGTLTFEEIGLPAL